MRQIVIKTGSKHRLLRKIRPAASGAAAVALLGWSGITLAAPVTLNVSIANNAPVGGVYLTPLWVGFHDGSFDSYDGGTPSSPGLEQIAEDGNAAGISTEFATQTGGAGVDGSVAGLLAPGATNSQSFVIDSDSGNVYFSYVSMVLPSSDYYVANGNPFAHSIASLLANGGGSLSFNIGLPGTVNDAGTEINNFWTSAGNGLFAGTGLEDGGQSGPNQGADENGVNANVIGDPFSNFIIQNQVGTIIDIATNTLPLLNFNDTNLYANGIATITITASEVPLPAAAPLMLSAIAGLFGFQRARKRPKS